MSEASVSPYTNLFTFQIWLLSQSASGGGFKYTSCFRKSLCKNGVVMSTDLRLQLLVIMVDSNVFKVSFNAFDSSSNFFILSPSKHVLLNMLLALTPYQFVLLSKPNKLKYIFNFYFPLFHKHCYLSRFQVLLSLPLHNISGCLYISSISFFCVLLWFCFHYSFDTVTGLVFASGFSCMTNNSLYIRCHLNLWTL